MDAHLSSEIDRLLAQWAVLAPDERAEVTVALASGVPLADAVARQRRLAELADRVSPEVHARISDAIRTLPPAERQTAIEEFVAKIERVETIFDGSALDATFDQVQRARPRHRTDARSATAPYELSIQHDYTDMPLTRAPLALVPHPDTATRPYAFVSLPLVIESTGRRDCMLKWEVP